MDSTAPSGYVMAQPRIPKVIGILNITFGAGLLLCSLCSGAYMMMLPMIAKATNQVAKQAEEQQKARLKPQLEELAQREEAAKTEEERIEIAKQKQSIEDQLKRPMLAPTMDLSKMGFDDPKLVGFMMADVVTGLILNVLMLVSGIALVRFKPWGVKLGLGVAVAKVLRLVTLYSYGVIVVVPWYSRKMAEFAVGMIQQQPAMGGRAGGGAPPIDALIRIYTLTYTVAGVAVIVVGSIYPLVCLWLLSRPGARAACLASKKLEERGAGW